MSLISAFVKNKITSIYSTSTDAYNDKTLTEVYKNVPCRWEEAMDETNKTDGASKEFGVRCWLLPKYVIKSDYQFLYKGQTYEVVGKEEYADIVGKHDHTVVYLGYVR